MGQHFLDFKESFIQLLKTTSTDVSARQYIANTEQLFHRTRQYIANTGQLFHRARQYIANTGQLFHCARQYIANTGQLFHPCVKKCTYKTQTYLLQINSQIF